MLRAGNKRILVFALSTKTPFFIHSAKTSPASFSVSIPIIRPMPLTDFTPLADDKVSKISFDFSLTPSSRLSSILPSTLSAAAQATGFPPKVEPWVPAVKTSYTVSPRMVAPRGKPPASPFAVETMSGVIP